MNDELQKANARIAELEAERSEILDAAGWLISEADIPGWLCPPEPPGKPVPRYQLRYEAYMDAVELIEGKIGESAP